MSFDSGTWWLVAAGTPIVFGLLAWSLKTNFDTTTRAFTAALKAVQEQFTVALKAVTDQVSRLADNEKDLERRIGKLESTSMTRTEVQAEIREVKQGVDKIHDLLVKHLLGEKASRD